MTEKIQIPSLRDYCERWFSRGIREEDLRYFVTLTFIDGVNELAAKPAIREFIKRLNRICFGRRFRKDSEFELKQICIVEENALQTTSHYHIVISSPSEISNRQQAKDFKSTISKTWKGFKVSGKNHLDKNDEWFIDIYDSDGMAEYLAKTENYVGMDFFDVENTNVSYR